MFIRFAAAVAFGLALTAPAAGQQTIASDAAWSVQCKTDRMTSKRECDVETRFSKTRSPMYELALSYSPDHKTFFALGSPEPRRVRIRIDGNPPFTLDACARGVCGMKLVEAPRLLQQMRSGTTLLIEFTAAGMPDDPLRVNLTGFDSMYQRALKP